jgi:hypothetical protein
MSIFSSIAVIRNVFSSLINKSDECCICHHASLIYVFLEVYMCVCVFFET